MGVNGGLPGAVPIVYGVDAEFNDASPGPPPAPVLPPNATVNVASFRPATDPNGAVAGGGMVAIFGSNLLDESAPPALGFSAVGSGSRSALGGPPIGLIQAETVPLPTELGGTSVRINNILAPLFFVSAGQINAQVPFGLPAGTYPVQVFLEGTATVAQDVTIADVSPGIFSLNQHGTGDGAILHATTFQLVTPGDPAAAGEFLSIFCTGLGALDTPVVSGDIPPTPVPRTVSTPQATIGGIPAVVDFSGLAPGFVGLYQVNVIVPSGLAPGSHDLVLTIDGVPANTVTVSVQ